MRLSAKAAIGTSLAVALSATLVLGYFSTVISQNLEAGVRAQVLSQVQRQADVTRAELGNLRSDALALAAGPALRAFIEEGGGGGRRAAIEARLVTLLDNHPEYFQARFIGLDGMEVVRVDRVGGAIAVTPGDALQDKSSRGYVRDMLALPAGYVGYSDITLNREDGRIERPLRPTLRVFAPVFDAAGIRRGGVVINAQARAILPPRAIGNLSFRVLNEAGSYLLHPEPEMEFGTELGTGAASGTEFATALLHPEAGIPGEVELAGSSGGGEALLAAFEWIVPDEEAGSPRWLFVATVPRSDAAALASPILWELALVVLLIAGATCLIGWVWAHKVTHRVDELAKIARLISNGDRDAVAEEKGTDEVSDMARAFNTMTERLRDLLAKEQEARELLALMNVELKRSNAELENYARAAAHDLKTPLRALSALPEWIEEDLNTMPDAVREHLEEMRRQTRRLQELVDSLLQYSILGRAGSRLETFDPRPVLDSVIAALSLPESFSLNRRIEIGRVSAVRTEFEIILRNLVQNAVKHHDREAGLIEVRVAEEGDLLVIEVTDDGPGVAPEERSKIFQPLYAGKSWDDGGGSGLGLAFVDRIAQRWSGSVRVQPAPGQRGARFRVTLPRQPREAGDHGSGSAVLAA